MNKDFRIFGYTLGISGEKKKNTALQQEDNFLQRLTREKWTFSDGNEGEKGFDDAVGE